jgi:hypothetical protein
MRTSITSLIRRFPANQYCTARWLTFNLATKALVPRERPANHDLDRRGYVMSP